MAKRKQPVPAAAPLTLPERISGPLKALLILGWRRQMWAKEVRLPFPPSPGLGIRIDVYDMLRVDSVVIGDDGYDVTCICTFEGGGKHYTESRVRGFGFEESGYP
ncbi:hypothetical protein [Limnoglobus roseus]|uniref:Uncharacterized protein n=1 Tax=Limnoglobus roseus TaxID=2598579 RepID=A0A5C1ADM0_9BACT|nr:hypothetical protein [Limnoglobus roseus]QEL16096.1 hypothetical protein PX52LOC_03035 [Limnoglobus roseus]